MDLDLVIVVDDDIDIKNPLDVEWALATRWDAPKGLVFLPDSRGHEMVPISRDGLRTKVGIDATLPYGAGVRHKRTLPSPVDLGGYTTICTPEFDHDFR